MRLRFRRGLLVAIALVAACGETDGPPRPPGDADRGRLLLRQYGCGDCHRIPGVATANAPVGPPLDHVGRRVYLAGVLPNSPANMALWIRAPRSVKPQTMMPDLRVQREHAEDMVAHLHRLR
jgi:cytochrome c1